MLATGTLRSRRGVANTTPQHDMSELAKAMKECLSDAGLRAELREKGLERAQKFSWQTTAEIVWKSLHEI